jgi:hypothetical protein
MTAEPLQDLAYSEASQTWSYNLRSSQAIPGYHPYLDKRNSGYSQLSYHEIIQTARWFYKYDAIAGTVLNRMADMAMTGITNRKKTPQQKTPVAPEVMAYYDALLHKIRPVIKQMALEYLLHGMVIPEYTVTKIRGDLISDHLGRTRYTYLEHLWVRNPDNIELERRSVGNGRRVFFKIPLDDIKLVERIRDNRQVTADDRRSYDELVSNFPEYVQAIIDGQTKIELNVEPILRKPNSYEVYPTPFLTNALEPLKHKMQLKTMDKSLADRAIESIRHFKIGDKDFPATTAQITAIRQLVDANSSSGERLFNLFTPHNVTVEWVIPPLEALMSDVKYSEPNADIFLALGFPRILTTGETLRSNSSDSNVASLGPKATLEDVQESIIAWIEHLYKELAIANGFKQYPKPVFKAILNADYTALIQFAQKFVEEGIISKDIVAQLYGSDYSTESEQMSQEALETTLSPAERKQERLMEMTRNNAIELDKERAKNATTNNDGNKQNNVQQSNRTSSR